GFRCLRKNAGRPGGYPSAADHRNLISGSCAPRCPWVASPARHHLQHAGRGTPMSYAISRRFTLLAVLSGTVAGTALLAGPTTPAAHADVVCSTSYAPLPDPS